MSTYHLDSLYCFIITIKDREFFPLLSKSLVSYSSIETLTRQFRMLIIAHCKTMIGIAVIGDPFWQRWRNRFKHGHMTIAC